MWKYCFLALCLFVLVSSNIFNTALNSKTQVNDDDDEDQITNVIFTVSKDIKRTYWYYLKKAKLIYQLNLDTPNSLHLFFLHRNRLGTFFCISRWDKKQKNTEIINFVRLGNGYSRDFESPYSPVEISPFIISLRLEKEEYLVQKDEYGNFAVKDQRIDENKQGFFPSIKKTQQTLDAYLREKYWYYLDDSHIVSEENIITNKKGYSALTYTGVVGTFLAIAQVDLDNAIKINTLVRLGAGTIHYEKLEPMEIQPSVIQL